jgi:DNA-binding Xre family transcriptional regulator
MDIQFDEKKIKIRMAHLEIDSQKELAERAGIAQGTLVRILNGGTFNSQTLQSLCNALHCSPNDILEYTTPLPTLAPALAAA